jgi:hypothetical protein
LFTSAPTEPALHWQQELLASKTAQAAANRQPATKTKRPSSTTSSAITIPADGLPGPAAPESVRTQTSSSNSLSDPAFWAAFELGNGCRRKVGGLLDERRYAEAYAAMAEFRGGCPDDVTDDMAADCANMTGRYAEAYRLLVPMVRRQGNLSPQFWLALSFASARLGQVYGGQAEYCRDQLSLGLRRRDIANCSADDMPTATDAKGVAVLSCLALGVGYGDLYYLETALDLDPTDVVAGKELVAIYTIRGRTADARRIAGGMVKNLPATDARRAQFVQALAERK